MHYHVDQIEDVLLGESLAATGGDIAQSDSQDELGNVWNRHIKSHVTFINDKEVIVEATRSFIRE